MKLHAVWMIVYTLCIAFSAHHEQWGGVMFFLAIGCVQLFVRHLERQLS
jgi:hypothetical protein